MVGNVSLGDHSFPRIRPEDLDELPRILHAFHESIGIAEGSSASSVDQLKTLFERDGVAPEAVASERYLEFCKSRLKTDENEGQVVGVLENFMKMWASKPDAWLEVPETADKTFYEVRRDMIVTREDPDQQATKKQKLDDESTTVEKNGQALSDPSEKKNGLHEKLEEPPLKKVKVEDDRDPHYAAADAFLPPDAPDDHESHIKCKISQDCYGSPVISIRCKTEDGRNTAFQVSVNKCISAEAALRLARACYIKILDEGMSIDEVKNFREECYVQFKSLEGGSSEAANTARSRGSKKTGTIEKATNGSEKALASDVKKEEVKKEEDKKEEVKKEVKKEDVKKEEEKEDVKQEEVTMEMLRPLLPEDAPAGHHTYGKFSLRHDHRGAEIITFVYKFDDGTKKTIQIMVKKACLPEAAFVIARALWVKLENGASADEAMAFRESWYEQLKPFVGRAAAPSNNASKEVTDSSKSASKEAKTADSSKSVSNGPAADKQRTRAKATSEPVSLIADPTPATSSAASSAPAKAPKKGDLSHLFHLSAGIDWDAVLPADAPAGSQAWQSVKPPSELALAAGRAVIRFKCADGEYYQVTCPPCLGDKDLACRVGRAIFVTIENGGSRDDVQNLRKDLYARIENAATGGQAASSAPARKKGRKTKGAEKTEKETKVESKPKSDASSNQSASDSSSSSSSDVEDEVHKIGKAVAKMAVRSGLRCFCHYALVCPKAGGSLS